jgi:hypothetical protein
VALLLGTAETVYDTCAQSILPQVVSRDRLPRANGRLIAAELTANEFVGPPLGGLLVAAGVVAAFATPAALWVAAVGALLLLRGGFAVPREAPTTLRADVAEGLRYLWRHRLLRTLAAMTGLFNFATNATFAVFVLYAVGPDSAMGLTEVAYGLLFATIAPGSLIGGLTNALWNVVAVSLRQRITPIASWDASTAATGSSPGAPDPWAPPLAASSPSCLAYAPSSASLPRSSLPPCSACPSSPTPPSAPPSTTPRTDSDAPPTSREGVNAPPSPMPHPAAVAGRGGAAARAQFVCSPIEPGAPPARTDG